jgi:hypothetical protein
MVTGADRRPWQDATLVLNPDLLPVAYAGNVVCGVATTVGPTREGAAAERERHISLNLVRDLRMVQAALGRSCWLGGFESGRRTGSGSVRRLMMTRDDTAQRSELMSRAVRELGIATDHATEPPDATLGQPCIERARLGAPLREKLARASGSIAAPAIHGGVARAHPPGTRSFHSRLTFGA